MARLIGSVQNKTFWNKLISILPVINKNVHKNLHTIGSEHVRQVHDLMKEKKTGRVYKIKGINHQASAPGESPAIQTGSLYRSVYYKVRGKRQIEIGASALNKSGDDYSNFLEKGTDKMKSRPYLSEAVRRQQGNTVKTVVDWNL